MRNSTIKKVLGNKSYLHIGGDTPLLGATIPEHLHEITKLHADREAVVSLHQDRRLTYRQLAEQSRAVAKGLLSINLGKGDRIGIWASNHVEWLIVQLATASIGAILVNINPAYQKKELAYALNKSGIQALFLMPKFGSIDYIAMITELVPEAKSSPPGAWSSSEFPLLKHLVLFDPRSNIELVSGSSQQGFLSWHALLKSGTNVEEASFNAITDSLDRDDPINIQYTSGTTGFPKAVVLSHHNILNNAWFTAKAMRFTERDRLCVAVPFYHCFGMVLCNLLCLSVGACLVLPAEHFDAESVLAAIEKEKCSAVHGVPTMFIAELEHPDFDTYDLSSLRTGIMAGAPCPAELMKKVIWDMNCRDIMIGYGQTEASPLTHLTSYHDNLAQRIETVGRNLPHQEVKLIDTETGRTVDIGSIGEICFRGYHVMRGYYNDAEATAGAIDGNAWLHSGDMGTMDEQGYVRITGRLKDMIIRGGENIYPREIEDLLYTHPKVAEAAVFGVPDDYYGEEIMAWVQLHEGETLATEELQQFCRDQIAHFKVPKYIWIVEEFPMTVTGKIQKFRMREIAVQEMTKSKAYHD